MSRNSPWHPIDPPASRRIAGATVSSRPRLGIRDRGPAPRQACARVPRSRPGHDSADAVRIVPSTGLATRLAAWGPGRGRGQVHSRELVLVPPAPRRGPAGSGRMTPVAAGSHQRPKRRRPTRSAETGGPSASASAEGSNCGPLFEPCRRRTGNTSARWTSPPDASSRRRGTEGARIPAPSQARRSPSGGAIRDVRPTVR